jgi:hypothetical protein
MPKNHPLDREKTQIFVGRCRQRDPTIAWRRQQTRNRRTLSPPFHIRPARCGGSRSAATASAADGLAEVVAAVPEGDDLIVNVRSLAGAASGRCTFPHGFRSIRRNSTILAPKRLGLMRQLLPGGTSIGYLDRSTRNFEADVRDLLGAAHQRTKTRSFHHKHGTGHRYRICSEGAGVRKPAQQRTPSLSDRCHLHLQH